MKFNKKIVWTSVIAVALALGGIYIASRQNAITHVIGDNNFEGSEKEWCDSLLDKLVVIDKKNCQIGKQKISQYSLTKKKHYVLWSSFFVTLRPNFCHRVYATP